MGLQHHIKCKPGDLGRSVLLPGDLERAKLISTFMDRPRHVASSREFNTYTGEFQDVPVSVISTGVGAPSASIVVEEAIKVGARNMIRVGTCGALQPNVHPGDLIIATAAVRGDGTTPEYIDMSYPAVADFHLVRALVDAADELGASYHLGVIRTHDAFYMESPFAHGDYRARTAHWTEANVLAVENEASAIFVISNLRRCAGACILVPAGNLLTGEEIKHADEMSCAIDLMIRVALRAAAKMG